MVLIKKSVVLLSILCCVILFGCSKNDNKNAESKLDKAITDGMKKMVLDDFTGARDSFREIIKKHPKSIKANYFLGVCHIKLKQFDEANVSFRTVLELDPEFDLGESIEIVYIRYLYSRNEHEITEREINKFSKLYPKNRMNAPFLVMIADSYRNRSMFDEALSVYKKIMDLYPDRKVQYDYAEQMVKFIEGFSDFDREPLKLFAKAKNQHLPLEALEGFREIVAKYPKSRIIPLVKLEIALSYDHGRLNLFESAIVYYQQLIDEYPDTDYAEVGRNNRERILNIFSQKVLSKGHLKAYEKGLENNKGQK